MEVVNQVDRSNLMNVLWDLQVKKSCIERDDITKIANEFKMSRMEVEGVITFYHFYHRKFAGKYTIYLNNAIVGKHSGMELIKKTFEKELGISVGKVTDDKMFGLFETSCIGLSDQEPACLINFKPFTNLTPEKVSSIIKQIREGVKLTAICDSPKSKIQYSPEEERTVFFKPYTRFSSLGYIRKNDPEWLIELVKQSKLTGRGGAFFPTGLKWQYCRQNKGDLKYLLCNADEGEPGTFKDRVLLQEHPELVIEGMILAAYAIGASVGVIYLRAEYMYLKKELQSLIDTYREAGYLGNDIDAKSPFSFDMYIHLGAGSYVCGEETAMIHSMEGKRGEPTTKEFFPVEKGFNEKPTVVNNVETLATVPRIVEMGLDHYLSLGTPVTPGTKLLSVSGDCGKPGIYEIEWGMKLSEFLDLIEAEDPNMVLFNGFAGECLSPVDFDREISGENLLANNIQFTFLDANDYAKKMTSVGLRSGGSFMTFNKDRDILSILKNIADFFVMESCGICVPCRTGNFLLNKKIDKLAMGHAEKKDMEDIKEWSQIITTTSRCGLGKMSSNSLNSAILKFPDVFKNSLSENTDFNKAFNLDKAIEEYDQIIKEISADYE
jgi:[NiFe] hydrogenase diaphorase moiety large subunit